MPRIGESEELLGEDYEDFIYLAYICWELKTSSGAGNYTWTTGGNRSAVIMGYVAASVKMVAERKLLRTPGPELSQLKHRRLLNPEAVHMQTGPSLQRIQLIKE